MSAPVQSTTVINDGLGRLTSAFKNKRAVKGLLKSMLWSVQDAENILWACIYAKLITSNPPPSADALDRIGSIVGEARMGRPDAVFLAAIKLRIRVNRSRGLSEDIIQIANLIAPGAVYFEAATAKWVVDLYSLDGTQPAAIAEFISLIAEANAAGVRGSVHWASWPYQQVLILSCHGASVPRALQTLVEHSTIYDPVYLPREGLMTVAQVV